MAEVEAVAGGNEMMTLGVVVLTLNAEKEIEKCLRPVLQDRSVDRCLVVDSSSRDRTVEVARALGAEIKIISRSEFNHGVTREAARHWVGTDIVVYLTQDAIPIEPGAIARLVAPIREGRVQITYGRQLSRPGSNLLESFPRKFNYPEISHIRTIEDISRYGVYTFFCSNSFAAYRQDALDRVGGFPAVLTNEDYLATAAILKDGGKIAYVAEAQVIHSHSYTLAEEFKRYFDTGYIRAERPWVQNLVGAAEKRGVGFVAQLLQALVLQAPYLIPYALLQTLVKALGYRIGAWSVRAPVWWKIRLSQQSYYWNSKYYRD